MIDLFWELASERFYFSVSFFNNKYTNAYYEEAMYNYNLILLVDFRLNFS